MRAGIGPAVTAVLGVLAILMGACGGPGGSPGASGGSAGESGASVQPAGSAGAPPSGGQPVQLARDVLAETLVDGLNLRTEPTTSATSLGILPINEPAIVVDGPVEADGYTWYQVASVREPYVGDCGDPAPAPSLECAPWFGWAAAVTPDGATWLAPLDFECPTGRDTATYLGLLHASRLACAGNDEWVLNVWIAPEDGGRGCLPVYHTVPAWLDGPCTLTFPQPDANQVDSDERIQAFVHPDLGACTLGAEGICPFEERRGMWVELVGHLDDPAAATCVAELAEGIVEAPFDPPDPDLVIHECRTRFVVTAIREGSAPS